MQTRCPRWSAAAALAEGLTGGYRVLAVTRNYGNDAAAPS